MAETCPILSGEVHSEPDGYVWEPNIPDECRNCFLPSLTVRTDVKTENWDLDPEDRLDLGATMLGGFCNYGIKIVEAGKREAIEEIGEEGTDELDGAVTSVSTWTFDCTREN